MEDNKERLAQIQQESINLRNEMRLLKEQKEKKFKESEEKRKERNVRLEDIRIKLIEIQNKIYAYNKLCKSKRDEFDILYDIIKIIEKEEDDGNRNEL